MASIENLNIKRKGYFSFKKEIADGNVTEQRAGLLNNKTDNPTLSGHSMLINKGEDDQMEICGYKPSCVKMFFTYLCIFLTAGLLRLVFHWIPHLYLKAKCNPCEITEAKFVLITEFYNDKHKIYYVKPLRNLTLDSIQKQKNKETFLEDGESGVADIKNLSVHFENGIFKEVDSLLTFNCKKVTYIWHEEKQIFIKLRGLDHDVSSDVLQKNKGLTKNEQYMRRAVYGSNEIVVKESTILTLLFLEVLNPYYIFQIFSFILWFADNYYYYAAAILLISVYGISMSVIQTRRNQRNLKSTVHSSDVVTVLRKSDKASEICSFQDGYSEGISTEFLVPGDILEIPQHGCIMHCDALLLTGNCILNESMLTGESVPVTKTPFPTSAGIYFDQKEHARHTLFCGTQVIQTRYFGNEKVLAVVIRTGFSTAKGGLVRSILYPPPVDFRFEKDSYRFVLMLAGIAGIGFIYTIITKVMRGVHARDLILEALDLITIVVPPALPAAMTVGRLLAQTRLEKERIYCISPRTINVSGSIDCVCFDKTGTLTEDGLDLLCVVPIANKNFEVPVKEVETLPYNVFVCGLVSCHSLTIIEKKITGDPLDLKMFESTKWSIEDPEVSDNTKFDMIFPTVFTPPKQNGGDPETDVQIGVIREFPFSSSAQRMGVIIRKLGARHFEYYSKGSPEMILNFVKKETIPNNFSEILEGYTQEGYRVIALAHKQLKLTYPKAQKIQREQIEHDMTLLGLIVLENRLKEDTTPCIQTLNDAKIRIIMVTGDNILTAVSVARDCGIITLGQSVITVNVDSPGEVFYTLTATKNNRMNNDASILSTTSSVVSLDTIESQMVTNPNGQITPPSLFNNYRFAITGKVWSVIRNEHPELIPRLVTRGSIFARMSPDHKQQLVQELQGLGYYVAMCGDGANDCGALKAAHTGISLSEAESSVASPFTSKNPNITCVLNIIKEGRAALVTSFGIFKYMASYSLCQFISVMILYSIDSNLTDIEFLYIDLFIISVFAFFFGRTESYKGKLVKETPLNSLISFSPIISLLLQLVLVIFFQILSFEHLKSEDWYVPFNSTAKEDKDLVACVENYTIFTVSSFQYIILAIVFSKGKPYRESVFTNYGLIISAIIMALFSVYLAIDPAVFLKEQFELVVPENFEFRLYLLIYAGINFILSILIEVFIVEHCVFKKLRFKFHNVYKSKRKYLAIEKDLSGDPKWPTLTSNYRSAASPMTPVPSCTAEIVYESERFDKNHVLNSFYNQAGFDEPDSSPNCRIDFKNAKLEYTNSTKSTPTYNPNKAGIRIYDNGKSLENGIDNFCDSLEFQSAVALASSDASFKTAEMETPMRNRASQSTQNTPMHSYVSQSINSTPRRSNPLDIPSSSLNLPFNTPKHDFQAKPNVILEIQDKSNANLEHETQNAILELFNSPLQTLSSSSETATQEFDFGTPAHEIEINLTPSNNGIPDIITSGLNTPKREINVDPYTDLTFTSSNPFLETISNKRNSNTFNPSSSSSSNTREQEIKSSLSSSLNSPGLKNNPSLPKMPPDLNLTASNGILEIRSNNLKPIANGYMTSEPYINHINPNKRIRSLSSNYTEDNVHIPINGNLRNYKNPVLNGDLSDAETEIGSPYSETENYSPFKNQNEETENYGPLKNPIGRNRNISVGSDVSTLNRAGDNEISRSALEMEEFDNR